MQDRNLTLFALFVGGALSVAVLLAAFLAALVISQRRRISVEPDDSGKGKPAFVLVGIDENGKDLLGTILEIHLPCPPECDATSKLFA